nr:Ig-like domain protein [Oriental turtle dovepox virus]
MVVGGVNITHWFLREFGSTATNLVVGVSADTNYKDWAKQAICGVVYYNHLKEYKIRMDSVYDPQRR